MLVTNKLTQPGGIRRVILQPDTVEITTHDNQIRIYHLVSESTIRPRYETDKQEAQHA
jgi:hypothetical protein